ncbi:glycosyltransferase [Ruania alba]|uniref:Glycosyltransferase, GT2 family n=1 Tax=Ruania alba TaxID=648782 RepID=A0A1H5NA39_9MICO|nr:glycosyltransferase [Ruania alba]SEE98413.1 Glycosyltransferase, GT2 family [Ruania alba]
MTASETGVRAVVVGAAASRFLPHTLAALASQTSPPDEIILAGLGQDRSGQAETWEALVVEAGLDRRRVRVVPVPEAATFGAAVRRALAVAERNRPGEDTPAQVHTDPAWLWLLHDDSAPREEALAELLGTVEASKAIAIVGSKQVDWNQPDRLISVGVRATRGGLRFTGIEDKEIDQGQHDGRDDVLAVGTAGMLIRADLWRALNGPDPALGPFEDGRDLCQRARLAGHRVVVAPHAVVRHARASYRGVRDSASARPDPRRSFLSRRTAALHLRLTDAPALLVPILAVAAVVTGVVRALWRVSTKELSLVGHEILAPLLVLARPNAVWRSRRRARRTRRLPARRLRPLQASWRDVWRLRRDRRMQAAAARRAARAPSELEIAERAAMARKRRITAAAVLVLAGAVAAVAVVPSLLAGSLIGGALLPADPGFAGLWHAATSPWLATGDGLSGPPDPLLLALVPFSLLTGGAWGVPLQVTLAVLLALAVPGAALGAWFAAGAATRSTLLRAWAALAWALGPPLLLGLGAGRVGAVLAHVAMPLVVLGVVRSLGLDRRDVVVSGMVGAQHVTRRSAPAQVSAQEAKRARLAALAEVGSTDTAADEIPAPKQPKRPAGGSAPEAPQATVISRISRAGSLGAAAAAGLAFALAAAGAPVLLPAGVVAVVVLALTLGRRRRLPTGRGRLVIVLLPALVLLAPLLQYAMAQPEGWRLLVANPGAGLEVDAGAAWLRALGWPQTPAPAPFLPSISSELPLAATAVLLAAAVLALVRGTARARAIRIGWLLVTIGILAAEASLRTVVGAGRGTDGGMEAVHGWAGPGTSLVLAGLLVAVLCGADGLRGTLSGTSFGWRQLSAAVGTVAVTVALLATGTAHAARVLAERSGEAEVEVALISGRGAEPVPALGRELQGSAQQARVLALTPTSTGLDAQIWRGNGPQLTESSTVADLSAWTADPESDAASTDLATVVAELANGTASDAASTLAEHAIAVVVVPATSDATRAPVDAAARARLIPVLDAVLGLDQVTENDSGVIWRVSVAEGATDAAIARAQVYDGDGALVQNIPSSAARLGGAVTADGTERTLVLAERADPAWHAWLGGTPLRAIDTGWQQSFAIPDGARGELEIRYHPVWVTPWRVVLVVVLGLTVLLALPTRRRRGEDAP